MRENSRAKEQFGLTLDGKQVGGVVAGALVILGGVFVLGLTAGRHVSPPAPAAAVLVGGRDALARLDEPLPLSTREDPAPALNAHDTLVDVNPQKTLPVPEVKSAPLRFAPLATPLAVAAPNLSPTPSASLPVPGAEVTPPPAHAAAQERPAAPPSATPVQKVVARAHPAPVRAAPAHVSPPTYAVQVGAANSRADAERLAKRYAGKGARVVTADVPGKGRWYRVQLGSYATREAAVRQVGMLSRSGVNAIVTATH